MASSLNQSALDSFRSTIKSTVSRKRQTLEEYISQTFSPPFYNLVLLLTEEQRAEYNSDYGIKTSASQDRKLLNKRNKRFRSNEDLLLSEDGFEMPQPKASEYPTHIREVLQFMQSQITQGDLVALQEGETCEENLINVYYKILQKVNLVLLRANEYIRQQQASGLGAQMVPLETQKVLYCNTNFLRELKNC